MNSDYGRYWDDFSMNEVIEHVPGKTITESDNNLFCLLTMNHHPLHLDSEYAKKTIFGQPVVVGTLILSIAVGMSVRDISGKAVANLGYDRVKHIAPVYIGDTICAKSTVLQKRLSESQRENGILQVKTEVYNQKADLVLTFERTILIPLKGV